MSTDAGKLNPKKSLGQNFLKSAKVINTMVHSPNLQSGEIVIEIGPGKGALTGPLLETGATVIAFELDGRMIEFLAEKFATYIESGKLVLVHEDIIEADLKKYTNSKEYSVVANIPYYITNLIMRKLLSGEHKPTHLCLLMQKEVAERIASRDGKESILSLSVKLYGVPKYIMKVSRRYFAPAPRVDSAVLVVDEIHPDINKDFEERFFTLVKTAFAQKRKQAIKNLSQLQPKSYWEDLFSRLHIETNVRAEDISFEQWKKMALLFPGM